MHNQIIGIPTIRHECWPVHHTGTYQLSISLLCTPKIDKQKKSETHSRESKRGWLWNIHLSKFIVTQTKVKAGRNQQSPINYLQLSICTIGNNIHILEENQKIIITYINNIDDTCKINYKKKCLIHWQNQIGFLLAKKTHKIQILVILTTRSFI